MLNWILKLDPNVVVPVLVTVGGWLYSKVRGKKTDTIERTIKGAIIALLSEVVDLVPAGVPIEKYLKNSRSYVEKYVWSALTKRGIPRNKTTERIVHMALEEATSELAKQLADERRKKAEEAKAAA
jgi:hypothetical protein